MLQSNQCRWAMRLKLSGHALRTSLLCIVDLQTCRGESSKYFGYCNLHQNCSVQPAAPRASVPLRSTLADERASEDHPCCRRRECVSRLRVGMSNSDSYIDSKGSCDSVHPSSLSLRMQRSLRRMRESIQKITGTIRHCCDNCAFEKSRTCVLCDDKSK